MVEMGKILPIILILLVLVSAVQAFQLNSMKEKLEGGTVPVSSGAKAVASSSAAGTPSATVPADINNLPQMVGGC